MTIDELLSQKRMSVNGDELGNSLVPLKDMLDKYLKKSMSVLEIGTFEGASASLFAMMADSVVTVDPYDVCIGGDYEQERVNDLLRAQEVAVARLLEFDNVKMVKSYSMHFFAHNKTKFDFVYIDGDHRHESVCRDIAGAKKAVKKGGYIAGHDWYDEGVKDAVEMLLGKPDETFQDGSWIKKV